MITLQYSILSRCEKKNYEYEEDVHADETLEFWL